MVDDTATATVAASTGADGAAAAVVVGEPAPRRSVFFWPGAVEAVVVPAGALILSLLLFGAFVACAGVNPLAVYRYMAQGSVGSWFSLQNTLTRAAPLILTGLCTALPAQAGLMIIGGEGALVIGGLVATLFGVALHGAAPIVVQLAMAISGMIAGGLWIALAGGLRHYRGVNETIASLLLVYIAIAILNQIGRAHV